MPYDPQFDEPDQDGGENRPPRAPLDKNQKIAVSILAVFAVFIIGLWFAQLRSNIYGPFSAPATGQIAQTEVEDEAAKAAALKAKDTDGDGLNDYDELNVYKTSPYLADTDSDGYNDGEEIKKGYDPNCPQGRTCTGGLLDNTSATSTGTETNDTLNSLLNQFGATAPSATQQPTANLNSDQLNALKNLDAASLRSLLIQAGMDKATLDKISDADLLKSYQETLGGR